jgi:hypothetical protein
MPIDMTGGFAAISIYSLNTGDMDETTIFNPEGTGRTFSAQDLAIGLTYSQSITDRFSTGATWKFINESYADISASTWAFDVGTIYRTEFKDVRIGMSITNFGPDIKFITESAPLPMTFHLGIAGEAIDNDTHKLTLGFELSHPNDNLEKFNFGTEYWWKKMVALRAGIKTVPDTAGSVMEIPLTGLHMIDWNVGAGYIMPISTYTFKIDYALSKQPYFDPVHRFTFGMEF